MFYTSKESCQQIYVTYFSTSRTAYKADTEGMQIDKKKIMFILVFTSEADYCQCLQDRYAVE